MAGIRGNLRTSEAVPYPYWREFVRSVEKLNEFVRLRCLRRYQALLLDRSSFEVVSPFSASLIQPARSCLLSGRAGYLFVDGARFWLVTGMLQQGHPLASFCSEPDNRIESLFPSPRPQTAFVQKHLPKMKEALVAAKLRSGVEMVIGHVNFAHHLWNELPALDEWLSFAADTAISETILRATAEPFGPLTEIFPQLAAARSAREPTEQPPDESRLCVRPGSSQISIRTRNAVVAYCEHRADQKALKPVCSRLQNSWPRIWISVRLESRTADNQLDYLLGLLSEIFAKYPDACCILDGFSFPIDFSRDARMSRYHAEFSERARITAEFIFELQNCAATILGSRITSQLCSISGLSLAEAVSVGSLCDYYICHAGTLQHKIAWLHNIPGFIHSPPIGDGHARPRWYAAQLEGGVMPDILAARYGTATERSRHLRDTRRNTNYHIDDIAAAVEFTIRCMEARLRQE